MGFFFHVWSLVLNSDSDPIWVWPWEICFFFHYTSRFHSIINKTNGSFFSDSIICHICDNGIFLKISESVICEKENKLNYDSCICKQNALFEEMQCINLSFTDEASKIGIFTTNASHRIVRMKSIFYFSARNWVGSEMEKLNENERKIYFWLCVRLINWK